MEIHSRLDPELAGPLETFLSLTGGGFNLHDIPAARKRRNELAAAQLAKAPIIEGVTAEDRHVPGPPGDPDVLVRIYQPTDRPATLPALVWIHGGGYVLGRVEQDDIFAKRLSLFANCVVASVEYRLPPEHPHPAPVEDCYAALKWFAAHTNEFGVDPLRIAIGGASRRWAGSWSGTVNP